MPRVLPAVATSLRVRPSWTATDTWSAISKQVVTRDGHALQQQHGVQALLHVRRHRPGAFTYALSTGRTYCFTAVATDAADNVSDPSPEKRCTTTPVDERSMAASTGWTNKTVSGYYRNTYRTTYKKNATLTLPVVAAKKLQLLTAVGPRNGTITATFRGAKLGTWRLAAARSARRTITLKTFSAVTTGRLVHHGGQRRHQGPQGQAGHRHPPPGADRRADGAALTEW